MKTYSLPQQIQGLIFDMDMTLYRNEEYYASQIGNQILLLAQDLGRDPDDLRRQLDAWQNEYRSVHSGQSPSFGNTLLGALDYPIADSVVLRRRAIRPEDYLVADLLLDSTLADLETWATLVLLTNNPTDVAERTLEVLGVRQRFSRIVGLDSTGFSKPRPEPFDAAFRALGLDPKVCVSIGDRFPVDLEVPLQRGSGALLIESMDDVYALPRFLASGKT